ncbi:MAG: polysaccharide deacetylase family protein [Bacteroidales bacterium]|jgi:peptidoglycan/xylan/chitin deacetylase (PgdA/CDA1 family)|nr:polysaccharide deacetylase family protein [Bacteroidales bacterium]
MIHLRTTFVLYIIVILLVYLFLPWKGIFFSGITLLLLAHIIYCSFNICSQAYLSTICKSGTREKKIAITFDDGPNEYTRDVLKILDQYNIKATFFCIGKNIEKNKDILQEIDDQGHIIGNHSWSHHKWFDFFPAKKMKKDILKNAALIEHITGKRVKLFRPPYGVTNPPLKKALAGLNYQTIGWSLRSLDTISSPGKVIKKLDHKLAPGDIILFHDSREEICEILESFISLAKKKSYQFVRLDELINIKPYA